VVAVTSAGPGASDADLGEPYRVLDVDGSVVPGASVPPLSDDELLAIYREMRLSRAFDGHAVRLQREGRMGTYPPLEGQEAAQVGSAHALAAEDLVVPSFREHGVSMVRGFPLDRILRYWMGDSRGAVPPEGANVFVPSVPIGTHVPHAVGAAWASTYRGEDRAWSLGNGPTKGFRTGRFVVSALLDGQAARLRGASSHRLS